MSPIRIMADSTCDLSPELVRRHNIGIIPLHVVFDDRTYRDGVELTTPELYEQVKARNALPRTSAPSPADFLEAFEPVVRNGDKIVYISLSSVLSSTYQNAVIASKEFPEGTVEVVDSLNLCLGIGLLVLNAVEYVNQGMESAEVAAKLREDVGRVDSEFVIDTLDYLHKGGRCSGTQMVIGSLLRIHPVIRVVDGGMIVAEKLRGKMDKVAQGLLDRTLSRKDSIDPNRVFVAHSMSPDIALWLKRELERELQIGEIPMADAGCVISSHCGPGTVGILFMHKA